MFRATDTADAQIASCRRYAGQAQAAALAKIVSTANQRDQDLAAAARPFRIDVLRDESTLADAFTLTEPLTGAVVHSIVASSL